MRIPDLYNVIRQYHPLKVLIEMQSYFLQRFFLFSFSFISTSGDHMFSAIPRRLMVMEMDMLHLLSRSAVGPSLLLARCTGTHCRTAYETRYILSTTCLLYTSDAADE